MGPQVPERVERWTAERRIALVVSILKRDTTAAEAARKHGLTVGEIEDWLEKFLLGAENALRNRLPPHRCMISSSRIAATSAAKEVEMPLTFQPAGDVPPRRTTHLREKTLADVAARLSRDEAGKASYQTSFKAFPGASDTISRIDLTVTLSIDMPVWDNYASRPPKERQEWDRFYRALLEHEKGHIQLFQREAQAMYTAMTRATSQTINKVHDAELKRILLLEDDYDRQTDHGRRQSTIYGSTVIKVEG